MDVTGANDPRYALFRHPQSKRMISRFRTLAGEAKLSEWQVFCVLLTGFLNYWAVTAGSYRLRVTWTPTANFEFLCDKLDVLITLDGLSGDASLQGPDFALPQFHSPYEFCRLVNKKAYDSRTTYTGIHGKTFHRANFMTRSTPAGNAEGLTWQGAVMVYDKVFFQRENRATTLAFLEEKLTQTVCDALLKKYAPFSALYNDVFRHRRARETG